MAKNIKDLKIAIEYIEKHGFVLKRQNTHLIFSKGEHTISVSKTPSDCHLIHNIKRNLRSFGITPI